MFTGESECTIARPPASATSARFSTIPSYASSLNPHQSDQVDTATFRCARMSRILYASSAWWNERTSKPNSSATCSMLSMSRRGVAVHLGERFAEQHERERLLVEVALGRLDPSSSPRPSSSSSGCRTAPRRGGSRPTPATCRGTRALRGTPRAGRGGFPCASTGRGRARRRRASGSRRTPSSRSRARPETASRDRRRYGVMWRTTPRPPTRFADPGSTSIDVTPPCDAELEHRVLGPERVLRPHARGGRARSPRCRRRSRACPAPRTRRCGCACR